MTPLLPQLADDLAAAAARSAAHRAGWWRRHRLRLAAFGIAGVVAVGGVATAATTLWQPQVGDGSRPPSLSQDPPPAAQLSALGVLRRPQSDADRGGESEYALRMFGRLRGVRLDAVRLLGTQAGGAGFVLVSAQGRPLEGTAERLRALKAEQEGRPAPAPLRDPLCLVARVPVGDGAGLSCFTLEDVLTGRAFMGMSPQDGPPTQFGLVPDAIAHVRAGDGPGAPTVEVHDNFFAVATPFADAAGVARDMTLHFLGADGREVMSGPPLSTVRPPSSPGRRDP